MFEAKRHSLTKRVCLGKAEDNLPFPGSMNELKNKTVKQLRALARGLIEEGVIRSTRTEIARARKAELIEWLDFIEPEDLEQAKPLEPYSESYSTKTRVALDSSVQFPPSFSSPESKADSTETSVESSLSKSSDGKLRMVPQNPEVPHGEMVALFLVGALTLGLMFLAGLLLL